MLLPLLLAVSLIGYFACALLVARTAYGIQRTQIIDRECRCHPGEDAVERFNADHQREAAAFAFAFGAGWPVTVPLHCVCRWVFLAITAHPPLTDYERQRRAELFQESIRRLEESLGMGPRTEDPRSSGA